MHEKSLMYIELLNLQPHPEGGFYREVYRSDEIISRNFLPIRFDNDHNISTSIYFLLDGNQISKFHRLKSDEIWHFYDGCSVIIYIIDENGNLSSVTLGANLQIGECFQTVIKRNHWFAAELLNKNSFCLVGCVVAPGFDFKDFELARREVLIKNFPQHTKLIEKFTA